MSYELVPGSGFAAVAILKAHYRMPGQASHFVAFERDFAAFSPHQYGIA
jgi:hypothetical protein